MSVRGHRQKPTSPPKTVLIVGATGRQGRAVISALFSRTNFRILALTRNASAASSKSLIQRRWTIEPVEALLELVQGDLDKPETIRKIFTAEGYGNIAAVFVALAFPGLGANADGEARQGILLADLALEYSVSHFIFSSVERGGESFDDNLTLDRAAKVKIERHIKGLTDKGLRWTILRPGFFMENFDGTVGKITTAVIRCGLQPNTLLQLIAVDDVGHIAVAVLLDPEPHIHKVIVVVGDFLTTQQLFQAHENATERSLPAVPNFVAKPLLSLNGHTRDLIADMERVHQDRRAIEGGHEAVLLQARAIYPQLMTFQQWAEKRAVLGKKERPEGWNNVSVPALVMGKQ
ncbi:NAD(P)-binding protein [Phlegmacium glaucopus]|nr:NAD(P)-binding protein [Phlegmacium glaucopus]